MSLMNTNIKKIAIVRLSALGDIVNSAVVLQFIHDAYPNATIDWICEEVFSDILQEHPLINKLHTINLKKFKKEKSFKLLRETFSYLRTLGEYDIIIDMQGLIKSAVVSRIIGKSTHGFDKNSTREALAALFYKTKSTIPYENNVIARNAYIISDALHINITHDMLLSKVPVFPIRENFELRTQTKNIAFVIGASWDSKIYPKEKIVKICDELQEQCYIIWGNNKEKETAQWITKHSKYATLAPQLSLSSLVAFISNMDLLIGNDTGPTHMAWAQNIASITLLGPTTTRMIYETPKNIGIKSSSDVNILKIDRNDYSIQDIDYKKIVKEAKELLK